MTNEYEIALLSGDGVGPELVESARQVLSAVEKRSNSFHFEFKEYLFGEKASEKTGQTIPDETMAGLKSCRAALCGALNISGKHASPMGVLRRELRLFANVRPVRSYAGVRSLKSDVDVVCIRENLEGFPPDRNLYKGHGEFMPSQDVVLSLRVITRQGYERIARFAFEYARKNHRRSVTVLHKVGIFRLGCGMFLEVAREVGREYPEIQLKDENVDTAANRLISNPEKYDVLLATNLFGDIIADVAAAVASDLVPTANIGPNNAMFMPLGHEPQFEEAGKGVVNPLNFLLCVAMLLEYVEQFDAAESLGRAVRGCISQGFLTSRSTAEVIEAVCAMLQ